MARGGADEDGWWVEGTADFFADMVYPCAGETADHASAYVAEDRLNLQDFPYSTVTFYMHLANRHGFDLSALADFLGRMATSAGFFAQYDALAAVPDIAAKFHEFGKAFTDSDIPCAGAVTGFNPAPVPVTVAAGTEVSLSVAPFRLKPVIVVVGKGEQYRARLVSPPGGGDGARTTSYRRTTKLRLDAWDFMPEDFNLSGGCDEDRSYTILSTVHGTDDTNLEAKLVFEGLNSDIPFEQTCGECPIGRWRRDIDHLNAAVNKQLPLGTTSGFMSLWLARDGVAKVEYSSFAFRKDEFLYRSEGVTRGTWKHVGILDMPIVTVPIPDTADPEAAAKDKAISIRWTEKGVTQETPHPGYELAKRYGMTHVPDPMIVTEDQRGPHAPSGRNFYTCESNDQLKIGGGLYWRMY
jgi:hypothetical protein